MRDCHRSTERITRWKRTTRLERRQSGSGATRNAVQRLVTHIRIERRPLRTWIALGVEDEGDAIATRRGNRRDGGAKIYAAAFSSGRGQGVVRLRDHRVVSV